MILYHFTSPAYVPSILAKGLDHGDVPVALNPLRAWRNCPWFTSIGSFYETAERTFNPGNRAVRLTVDVPAAGLVNFKQHCKNHGIGEQAPVDPLANDWFHKGRVGPEHIKAMHNFVGPGKVDDLGLLIDPDYGCAPFIPPAKAGMVRGDGYGALNLPRKNYVSWG